MRVMAKRRRSPATSGPRGSASASRGLTSALPAGDEDDTVRWITRAGVAILLIATIALVCYVRLRLADAPLERDEGEYAYAGQLILKGVPPYQAAYNMKFPGVYYAYAGIMAIFGQTAWGIRVGLLAVHLSTVLLLFMWSRRVVGTLAAGVGASAFALLALDRWSMGVFAHATHFVLLPVVGALALMQDTTRAWRLVSAGLLFGLAVIMKQQAITFAAFGIALAIGVRPDFHKVVNHSVEIRPDPLKRGALVTAGIAASLALLLVVLAFEGVIGRFWFWTFQYAAEYVSQIPASLATTVFDMAWTYVTQATAWLWYLGLAGLAAIFMFRWTAGSRVLLAGWFVAAALAIVPGFFFRAHYFIVIMPVVGLLLGVVIASIDRALARAAGAVPARVTALLIFVAIAGIQVQRDSHFLFRMTAPELMRAVYPGNPFVEAPEIAAYLKAHTAPTDRIAVLGSEPEILFYADRPSATGYIYMYALTERQQFAGGMQEELMSELRSARPTYVVHVDAAASWVATLQPDNRIVTWANAFTAVCYDRVGIVDVNPDGPATIRWDSESIGYQARSKTKVTIFKRHGGTGCDAPGTQ